MESVSLSKKSFEKKKRKEKNERGEKVREDERSIRSNRQIHRIQERKRVENRIARTKGLYFSSDTRYSTYRRIRDISFQEALV